MLAKLRVAPDAAARHVEQRAVERVADAHTCGAERVEPALRMDGYRVSGVDVRERSMGAGLDVAALYVRLDAEHPGTGLPVVADLGAAEPTLGRERPEV